MVNQDGHIYIKTIRFERNVQTGNLDVFIVTNHGEFRLGDNILDPTIVDSFYDYLREQAADEIQRYLANTAQQDLMKSSKQRYIEALQKKVSVEEQVQIQSPLLSDEETEILP